MNGDEKKIYDAVVDNGKQLSKLFTKVAVLEKKQELQHQENKKTIGEIKAHDIACSKDHTRTKTQVRIQWWLISTILVGVLGIAWTSIK